MSIVKLRCLGIRNSKEESPNCKRNLRTFADSGTTSYNRSLRIRDKTILSKKKLHYMYLCAESIEILSVDSIEILEYDLRLVSQFQ